MSTYAIKADTFFLPTRVAHGGYLMVEDGVFGAYVTDEPDCEILDLAGKQVAPGFVDTHIHGFDNCDVMDCKADSVRTISRGILRNGVTSGMIDPFHCRITAQDGSVKNSGRHGLDLEQIAHMDYLCDAVDGHIPEYDELAEVSKPMYRMQGIHRDLLPVEKEAEL